MEKLQEEEWGPQVERKGREGSDLPTVLPGTIISAFVGA